MPLTEKQMEELDKQAAADDAKDSADSAELRKWFASPEYQAMKEKAKELAAKDGSAT